MTDDTRVQELLDELLDSDASPEEVCGAYPELLSQVRDRWRQMCHARAELDALFPPLHEPGRNPPAVPLEVTTLPVIPGYEVEAVLGLGGMGVVFRARHLRLKRLVALKMALAGAYAGPHERERFQREAEAVAALRHPNVVQIHDVGDSDGRPYFTMEYVEGGSLAQKLAGIPQPSRQAAALQATLARAVHAAHESGIVHRDLKPANVLLTADGTPKVSDFGLARRLGGEAGLTRTGMAVGTPSYMAPEQAQGKTDAAGPAADIYALGAILYEMLTGRPPFRAETAAETVHQLLSQDPVPPSRLNGKVPRDLEIICLTCLRKEPRLRYTTAAALADDLDRFLRGEPIAARPEGRLRRFARRIRRRPTLSVAVAVSTLFALALIGGGLWSLSDREATARASNAGRKADLTATERAAEQDLTEMEEFLRKSKWDEAKAALARANGRLEGRGSTNLRIRERMDQGTRDLKLVHQLASTSLNATDTIAGQVDFARTVKEYEAALRAGGFVGSLLDDPKMVGKRIAASNICNALVAALDDWAAYMVDDPKREKWLLSAAREAVRQRAEDNPAERDPTGWSDRARDPEIWSNEAEFIRLVETAPVADQPVPLLLKLAQHLHIMKKTPVPFLLRIQQAHPEDFNVNSYLGRMMMWMNNYSESLRYYQAALAIRPSTSLAHDNLGGALILNKQPEKAVEQYRLALKIDPTAKAPHYNLALALSGRGPYDEAIEECNLALKYYPKSGLLYACLGKSLAASGRDVEAIPQYQKALQLEPKMTHIRLELRTIFIKHGRLDEARQVWQSALEINAPEQHGDWYGYAEFCLFLGKEDEYRQARKALLSRFGTTTDPQIAERTGRACLLLSASGDELRQAVALADRAMNADPSKYQVLLPSFALVKGLADYRQGRYEQAISGMQGDASRLPGPTPQLILAMALFQKGNVAEARQNLALAILTYDWRAIRVRDQDGYIAHVLRREAERMILPNLPTFLEGKYQPREVDERIALLGVCQFTNRSLASAQCYADTFADAPNVAEDYSIGRRYMAACAATRVGCGKSEDAAHLGEPEQTKWRAQARAWLRADLAAWGKALDSNLVTTRDRARQSLTQWQADPDLAGLREPAELEKLPPDERKDCLALWSEVGALLNRCGNVK